MSVSDFNTLSETLATASKQLGALNAVADSTAVVEALQTTTKAIRDLQGELIKKSNYQMAAQLINSTNN